MKVHNPDGIGEESAWDFRGKEQHLYFVRDSRMEIHHLLILLILNLKKNLLFVK
jgi:hypothetical protein